MARYNLIQIGATYLTRDGLAGGVRCKTRPEGLDALKLTKTGQVQRAIDGTPYMQVIDNSMKGLPVSIRSEVMEKTVFDTIVTAINAAITGNTTIAVNVTGDTGTFNLTCVPRIPQAVEFTGEFNNERIKDVAFHFVTA